MPSTQPKAYTFTFYTSFKPYVRMTARGKFVKPDAQEYLESQSALAWEFKRAMLDRGWEMLPPQTPLQVCIHIEMPGRLHRQDLDNQLKALGDAAQGVVFKNDLWIDKTTICRQIGSAYKVVYIVEVL